MKKIKMKNRIKIVVFTCLLVACKQNDGYITHLENQIKELKIELHNAYKPGFGDIMGNIQSHHSKLWFAGKNHNWKLAKFEIHEIEENFNQVKKHQKSRKETAMIPIVTPVIDSISRAIEEQDYDAFENNFKTLTNTCNMCHKANNYEFIQIKIPDIQSINNQVFK